MEQKQETTFFNRFSDKQVSILSFVGILVLLAGFLTVIGYSKPHQFIVNEEVKFTHKGEFSYTGAADPELFDSDQLQPGDPIFQNLNDSFDVSYDYQFIAQNLSEVTGTYSLSAVIGASNGWHRQFNLIIDEPFDTPAFTIESTVNLIEIRTLIEKMINDTGYRSSSFWLKIETLIYISGSINEIPVTEIHSSVLDFSYDPIQLKLSQPISNLIISEPQYLLKRINQRSEVDIPFVGITIDTYTLRVIGLGSLAIVASILIYLAFVWSSQYPKRMKEVQAFSNVEALSNQGFINELGFETSAEVQAPEVLDIEKDIITETAEPAELTDEDQIIDRIFGEGSIQSSLGQDLEVEKLEQSSEPARKSRRKRKQEKLSTDGLNSLLNNKNTIIVESLNLEGYKKINITNTKQLLGIAEQENSPIYHIFEEDTYKFVISLPEKKISYLFSPEIEDNV